MKPILGPSVPLSFLDANGGGFADPAFIPAFYIGMPVNDRLSIGGGFNGPFGITTEPDNDNWVGKFEARSSKLSTYNLNPVMSYRMTSSLVVGAGAQFEFADTALKSAFPAIGGLAGLNPNVVIKGDSFGLGYTLGALWRPSTGTDIGLGFRSSIEHALEGESFVAGVGALGKAKISADLEMPSIATTSIRQKAGERLTLIGTIEWTNWSELEQVVVRARTSNPDLGASAGDVLTGLPFHWHDGWLFAGGAEFAATERTTLRAGAAWEASPVQNPTERLVRVPDADRTWLSVGATFMLSPMTSMDLAYSHVFIADGAIDRASTIPGLGLERLVAEAKQDINILGLSIKVKLGKSGSPLPSP
ncbi:MAG: OmpP1/FadL family transporter [Methyloceanibacter sp.]